MRDKVKVKDLSPLRYPGSKKRLVLYLCEIIKYNKLNPDVLIEPFAGGGNIALHFLLNQIVNKAIIADKDKLIYSFWNVLFSNPDYLIDFIKKVKVNLNNFYRYKEMARNFENYEEEKLAEACIYLNRTSFSGIMTDIVGPLGGKNQQSQYKIDCRFNKKTLIEKMKYISSLSRNVIVLSFDWKDTIKYAQDWVRNKKRLDRLFFYFDPPFFNKANDLYRCYFNKEEHKQLYEEIICLNYDWVLSYDNAPEIRRLYSNDKYITMHMEVPYSINSHAKRIEKELIITPLALPKLS